MALTVQLCANQDLGKVDNFLLGGFLTEAQASRRWYTKIVTYVTYGGYSVGKNNGMCDVETTSGRALNSVALQPISWFRTGRLDNW